jgi:hypothetical protein
LHTNCNCSEIWWIYGGNWNKYILGKKKLELTKSWWHKWHFGWRVKGHRGNRGVKWSWHLLALPVSKEPWKPHAFIWSHILLWKMFPLCLFTINCEFSFCELYGTFLKFNCCRAIVWWACLLISICKELEYC